MLAIANAFRHAGDEIYRSYRRPGRRSLPPLHTHLLARLRAVVAAEATVGVGVVLCTGREARVELRPLEAGVRIEVDSAAWARRDIDL